MGACLSGNVHDEDDDVHEFRSWSCFGGSVNRKTDLETTRARVSELSYPDTSSLEPQRRPEMESIRIQADENQEATSSNQWFVSTRSQEKEDERQEQRQEGLPQHSISTRKRKRSLSVALRRQTHLLRRPRTAPEMPKQQEWRVSLRGCGTRSPFPDFSTFAIRDDDDDIRSSYTYVDRSSAVSNQPTSRSWPLPDEPAPYPSLEVKLDGQGITHETAQPPSDHQSPSEASSNVEKSSEGHSGRRSRALSEPFRYAKRKHESERQSVDSEIQELRTLVEERKRNTEVTKRMPASQDRGRHHQHHPRNSSLLRSDSRGHIPAVAPSMKVRVRSQVLNDIGSAFTRPLSDGSTRPGTPEMTAEDVSKVSPLRVRTAQAVPSMSQRYDDANATSSNRISGATVVSSGAGTSILATSPLSPVSPGQKSLSRPSSANSDLTTRQSFANRGSNLVSGIWQSAKGSIRRSDRHVEF